MKIYSILALALVLTATVLTGCRRSNNNVTNTTVPATHATTAPTTMPHTEPATVPHTEPATHATEEHNAATTHPTENNTHATDSTAASGEAHARQAPRTR